MVYRRGLKPEEVRGTDALLVIEVSAEFLSRDLRDKAAIYAEHRVPEYWVVDAGRSRRATRTCRRSRPTRCSRPCTRWKAPSGFPTWSDYAASLRAAFGS